MKLARRLTVLCSMGIFARHAATIDRTLAIEAHDHVVTFAADGREVDAKSILGILGLEACEGRELLVTVNGPEAQRVLDRITELFDCGFEIDRGKLPRPAAHDETTILEP